MGATETTVQKCPYCGKSLVITQETGGVMIESMETDCEDAAEEALKESDSMKGWQLIMINRIECLHDRLVKVEKKLKEEE